MDITPQDTTKQPTTDDQELAKALAGVITDESGSSTPTASTPPVMQFEETPAPSSSSATPPSTATPAPDAGTTPSAPSDLDSIKKDALGELRPLIGKVDLPPEEMFDTYLMLIRSTDDSTLIAPAHEAAQRITDEKRRAEALLDIIKEIDYLSREQKPVAA